MRFILSQCDNEKFDLQKTLLSVIMKCTLCFLKWFRLKNSQLRIFRMILPLISPSRETRVASAPIPCIFDLQVHQELGFLLFLVVALYLASH